MKIPNPKTEQKKGFLKKYFRKKFIRNWIKQLNHAKDKNNRD